MKKIIFILFISMLIMYFILNPKAAVEASQNGIMTWWNIIFPTLFPCLIVSNLLINSNLLSNYRNEKILKLITIICGLMLGFPIGAKLTTDFYSNNYISKKDAQILCAFTNNISPAYIASVVINQTFNNSNLLFPTYFVVYFPSILICVFVLLRNNHNSKKSASRFQLNMQIIDAGIISGFETLIRLCGYITLFSVIVNMLQNTFLNHKIILYLTGLLEITNGIFLLSTYSLNIYEKYLLSIFFLSFGGLSFIFQTEAIIHSTDLSIKKYVLHKILSSFISITLTVIILFCFRII